MVREAQAKLEDSVAELWVQGLDEAHIIQRVREIIAAEAADTERLGRSPPAAAWLAARQTQIER